MAIFPSSAISSASGYEIDQSLRFNDNDTAYLSKTPAGAGDSKTWTWSGWVKKNLYATVGSHEMILLGSGYSGSQNDNIKFNPNDGITLSSWHGSNTGSYVTDATYRDPSAWYHIVVAVDTTDDSAGDRCKIYINGTRQTTTGTNFSSDFDTYFNATREHTIGKIYGGSDYLDGYLAEVHFIDGTVYDADDFGETDSTYGHWKPKKVSGLTYGTNGFYLDFSDSAALGDDAAGSNDWTVNNLTASDQMLDSPTNNFATMNPLVKAGGTNNFYQGNLWVEVNHASGRGNSSVANFSPTSGKWYGEIALEGISNGCAISLGNDDVDTLHNTASVNSWVGGSAGIDAVYYTSAGGIKEAPSGNLVGTASTYANGDIIQFAVDLDNGKAWFGKNNTWQLSGNPATGANAQKTDMSVFTLALSENQGSGAPVFIVNFGQDSSFTGYKTAQGNQDGNEIGDFYYTPPTGFLALCTSNLPDPAVIPSKHFNTVLWSGDGNDPRTISGVGFQPDLINIKLRSGSDSHHVFDAVRGAGTRLILNTSDDEESATSHTAFTSDGFTISDNGGVNGSNSTYVSWNWKANGSGSANTVGDIDSTVSANQDAGFSIVSWTGDSTNDPTIGHGLSKAPEMIIHKHRSGTVQWNVYHKDAGTGGYLSIDRTNAWSSNAGFFGTAPTASVFSPGSHSYMDGSGNDNIAYCWHSVEGYSKCGEYEGNGYPANHSSTFEDGPFIYLGFRPKWIMIRNIVNIENWLIYDSERKTYNSNGVQLGANTDSIESDTSSTSGYASVKLDMLSNGFKIKSENSAVNYERDYIYLAFAETPFKYANAR